MVLYELKIDKELENLCPALSADELRLLEESIESEGCRDEIVLWANHDKTIIDGHNRYRICKRLKLPYKTKSIAFVSKDEVKLWMLRNQMGRRNLNESQRAMAASRLATLLPGNQTGNVSGLTQAEAAEAAGVSDRTIRSAKKVIERGTPELQKAVIDGEVPVSAAAEIAEKPAPEQKKIVAKGAEAVKAEAKKSKAKKKQGDGGAGECPRGGPHERGEDGTCEKCKDPPDTRMGQTEFDTSKLDKQLAADKAKPDLEVLQAPYDAMLNAITQIKKLWNEVCGDERDGVYAAPKKQRVMTLLDELRPPLAQARPMKVCTFCKGKGCEKCQGCGWWPRSVVEGLSR